MAKWRFSAGITFEFPDFDPAAIQAHFLKPLERIIVSVADEATTRSAYPSIPAAVRVFGPWQGQLANGDERLTLEDKNGVKVCSVRYEDGGRWPMAADGTGHSIVLVNENREVDDWHNWRRSSLTGGSPGIAETPAVPIFHLRSALR